jgi:hypothetical protein
MTDPTAPGVYPAHEFSGAFDTATGFEFIGDMNDPTHPTGDMILTMEPLSLSLMAAVLSLTLVSRRAFAAGSDRET